MGSLISTARVARFPNAREIIPPVRRGLVGWFNMQGAADQARRNLAPANVGKSASLLGSPVFADGYMQSVSGTSGLQTDLDETPEFTWLWAGLTTDDLTTSAHQPTVMGNFNGSSGASIWLRNHSSSPAPAARAVLTAYDDTNNQSAQNVINVASPRLLAARVSAGQQTMKDMTANLQTAPIVYDAPRTVASRKIRIGSSFSPTLVGTVSTAFAAVFTVALTDAELDVLYAFVKAEMADNSIAI